jgi:hypothetical protein
MSQHTTPHHTSDALDELARQLLECGAILSQIISHMVRTEAAGKSAPDAAPIPDVAFGLIRDVITELKRRHSGRAASIVGEAAEAIGDNIFMAPLD